MSLDQFNGTRWDTEDLDVAKGLSIAAGGPTIKTNIEGLVPNAPVVTVTQTVTLLQPPGEWLPMAFHPDSVSVGKSSIRYDPSNASAVPSVGAQPGLQYTVVSTIVQPTRADLESVPPAAFKNPE